MFEQAVAKKINRYQIVVMLLTAAVTYHGLCLLMPGERASDRIASVQAQALAKPLAQAQNPQPPGAILNPVVEAIPMQTQVVHSSRWSTKRARMVPTRRLREGKPSAEIVPTEEYRRRLELGLVPEAIVLPKKEEYEISSLILVKPQHGSRVIKKD